MKKNEKDEEEQNWIEENRKEWKRMIKNEKLWEIMKDRMRIK